MIKNLLILLFTGVAWCQPAPPGNQGGGNGSPSQGPVDTVQTSDGSNKFKNSGCTAVGGKGTCPNGFEGGTIFKEEGVHQSAAGYTITAPTTNKSAIVFDTDNHDILTR